MTGQHESTKKTHENQEIKHGEKHEKHPPHHELPPHLLKELFDLKEKVGRLEGQMDILLRLKTK